MSVLYAITDTVSFRSNFNIFYKSALRKIVPVLLAALSVQVSLAQVAQKPGGSSLGIHYQVYQNSQGGYSYKINNGESLVISEEFAPVSEVNATNKSEVERLAVQTLNIYKANTSLSVAEIKAERQYQINKARSVGTRGSNGINQNTLAVCTFAGTLQNGDPQITGRLFRDAIASTCASVKTCPGPFGSATFNYDTHTITNPTASPACVTVGALSTNGQQVHVTAYLGSYNPANICQNYLADQGSSSITTPVNFSFNIPAGGSVVLVIYNPINGTLTTGYNINVDNCPTLPCQPIVITGHPSNVTACELTNATFSVTAGPAGISYNWQEDRGSGFVYLTNGGQYSGVTTSTLTVSNVNMANNGWRYRAVITCSGGGLPQISNDATLTVLPAPAQPVISPATSQICPGGVQQLNVFGNATTLTQSGVVTIPAGAPGTTSGPATPYPSALVVSGLPVNAIVQSVTINGLTHTFPADIDMLLRSPTGQNVIFMSDAGGATDVNGINITFNDAAPTVLPATLVSGTFRPTNIGGTDNFIAPGPGSVTDATPSLGSFTGDPNGTWQLYIVDDVGGDVGQITSWSITFATPGTAIFTPQTGLYLDAGLTTPYTGGSVATVYASPSVTTTYTAVVNNGSCNSATATATVTVNAPPVITSQPSTSGAVCEGDNKSFSVTATGTALTYQWQVNMGSGFVNITDVPPYTGATTSTLTITGAPTSFNNFIYRVVVSGTCPPVQNSNSVTLVVNPLPTVVVGPQNVCSPVTLTATGANTYTWAPAGGLSSTTGSTVTATPSSNTTYTVTGTITATGCTNIASVTVLGTPRAPAVTPPSATICLGGSQLLSVSPLQTFTNAANITIPSLGNATPYPSNIAVSGLTTSGVAVQSVTITNFSHTWPDDVDIVLQSPTGTNVILMSDAGGSTAITNRTYTFSDAAPTPLADAATNLSGTYRPTNYGTPDNFPAPGPGSLSQLTPTIASFGTGNHNGTWRLFVVDAFGGDQGSIAGGWNIVFNTGASPVIFSPTTGLFNDAALTIPYTGTAVTQVYASPAVTTTYNATGSNSSTGFTSFTAKGPIQLPGIGTGGATSISTLYPSTASVNGIPAGSTVKSVTLNGLNHTWSDDIDIVLQSPTGVNVILMSDAGGSGDLIGTTYVFDDAAVASLADATVSPSGTYKPSNYALGADNFPAPGPGSLTQGTNPLLSSFTGDPNGVWKLFAIDDTGGDIGNFTNWTITFNTPVVTCTGPSTAVTITVEQPIVITQQPTSKTACAGDNVTFTVTATGTITTYQWQVSTDGGVTWTNIAGANTATLTLSGVTTSMNNNRYRVVLSNVGCGPTNSAVATLTVNPLPTVTLTASPYTQLRPGMLTTLTVTSSPAAASWQWFRNGVLVPGITTGTYVVDAFNLGNYSVTVTDVNGCRNTTNTVSITALPSNNLFIFPNPATGGMFTVTYYTPNTGTPVTINVIDMKGRRIESRVGTTTAAYTRFDFSTLKLGAGVYVIEFRNPSGERLAAGRVVVIR